MALANIGPLYWTIAMVPNWGRTMCVAQRCESQTAWRSQDKQDTVDVNVLKLFYYLNYIHISVATRYQGAVEGGVLAGVWRGVAKAVSKDTEGSICTYSPLIHI